MEAKKWLDMARKERSSQEILISLSNLENILYQGKIKFADVDTSIEEIRRLKAKAYKKECLHWLHVSKKKNSLYAIGRFEANRKEGGFSYGETGTSNLEMSVRKITAKVNNLIDCKTSISF